MYQLFENTHFVFLLAIFFISLFALSKASDLLVDNAVKLSELLALPELIIGVTIVSLGTTMPELSAAIVSALQGNGDFALGNAVGSVITNSSLILGVASLFGSIPFNKSTSSKITILNIATVLLILPSIPYKITSNLGLIPQWMGILMLLLIPIYIYYIIRQEQKSLNDEESEASDKPKGNILFLLLMIVLAAIVIALSASTLVNSTEIIAERIGIPDIIISSTLVAFGTSVPELSTCIAAAKNKHGALAIGNIIGANILNILFVIGVSAALSRGGVVVTDTFYFIHYPALIIILIVLGYYAYNKKVPAIKTKGGLLLIVVYGFYLGLTLMNTF